MEGGAHAQGKGHKRKRYMLGMHQNHASVATMPCQHECSKQHHTAAVLSSRQPGAYAGLPCSPPLPPPPHTQQARVLEKAKLVGDTRLYDFCIEQMGRRGGGQAFMMDDEDMYNYWALIDERERLLQQRGALAERLLAEGECEAGQIQV